MLDRLARRFKEEEDAHESFKRIIWPHGFLCRRCQSRRCRRIETRSLYVCCDCGFQHSLTAGTLMHRSRIPLSDWAIIIFLASRPEARNRFLSFAKGLGISQRHMRRLRTKLIGPQNISHYWFIRAFMADLEKP